jgi:TP901 family phage tail tape measure protein
MAADELSIALRLRGARAANADLNATATSINRVNAAARRSTANLGAMSKGLSRTGSFLTRNLTLPLVVAGGAAVKLSMNFEDSIAKIQGLAGVGAKEVGFLRTGILNLAGAVGIGPKSLADAMFYIESAGIHGARGLDVLRMSAKASAAGLGDLNVITDGVTSAINAYADDALTATQATDGLVAAVRLGKMPADALVGTLGRILPLASALHVAYSNVLGTMAALSRVGVSPAQAATGISSVLSGLLKPTTKGSAALSGIGLSYGGLRKELATQGVVATLRTISTAAHGNLAVLAQVFPNIRALRTLLALLAQNGGTVNHVMKGVADSTGATNRAFDVASHTTGFKMRQAFARLQAAGVRFGDTIAPVIAQVAGAVGGLAALLAGHPTAGISLLVGLALLGPALKLVAFGFKAYRASLMLTEGATFAATVASEGLGAALFALPITWIILGLIALGVGIYEVVTHFKFFKRIVGDVWKWLKANVKWVAIFAPGVAVAIELVKHFNSVKNVVMEVVNAIKKAVHWVSRLHIPGGGVLHSITSHLPGFASGGVMQRSGAAIVGEQGPEIVSLPGGSSIASNSDLVALLTAIKNAIYETGNRSIVVNGREIALAVARQTADARARA